VTHSPPLDRPFAGWMASPPQQPRPTAAAAAGAPPTSTPPSPDDLLIVGPGVLGAYLGLLWKAAHPGASVVAQTNTPARHAALASLGLSPRTGGQATAERYGRVAFAAPPSGSADYVGAVQGALALWDASAPGACFVFTGSAGVVGVDDGSAADEASPAVARGGSPRTDTLLAAEDAVLGAGGCVLRLAGLYHATRGAHAFFLKAPGGVVPGRAGGYTVNLLHYEDAARLAAAVLGGAGAPPEAAAAGSWKSRVFLGCDGAPLTFDAMVAAAAACPAACPGGVAPATPISFGGPAGGPSQGKRLTNPATRAALGGWQPKYASFEAFCAAGGKDAYNSDARLGGVEGAAHA